MLWIHHQNHHTDGKLIHCTCITSSCYSRRDELVAVEDSIDVGNNLCILLHSSPKEVHIDFTQFSRWPRVTDPDPWSCQVCQMVIENYLRSGSVTHGPQKIRVVFMCKTFGEECSSVWLSVLDAWTDTNLMLLLYNIYRAKSFISQIKSL